VSGPPASPPWGYAPAIALGAILGAAAIVRFLGSLGDLWLDEVWTPRILGSLRSPLEILTFYHDNNHILNSLSLWPLRHVQPGWLLRLPAMVAGSATVAVAAQIGWIGDGGNDRTSDGWPPEARPASRAAWCALLVGFAYPLVLYGSEARGYSFAL